MTLRYLFSRPVLYCISDQGNGDPIELLRAADSNCIEFFQFRHKYLSENERWQAAASVVKVPRWVTRLLVNETISLARAIDADGVHLPAGSVSIETARAELAGKLAGVSVHSLEEALQADEGGADYLLLAPVFCPISKALTRAPLGLEGLRQVCSRVTTPVIALGGVTPECFTQVLDAGAAGVAGISLFADATGLKKIVERFRQSAG
ncbi:MAG: thiamine phosphate synthase [Acidobacteria bacterium]|nr:thiamine phosphate synthase [Acidobacteriota bacterium]